MTNTQPPVDPADVPLEAPAPEIDDTSQQGTASSPMHFDPQADQSDPNAPGEGDPKARARALGEGETIGATGDTPAGLQKDPEDWVTGDEPMTPAQRSYLDNLARQAGEELPANLTKAEASEHIDRLQQGRSSGQQGRNGGQ